MLAGPVAALLVKEGADAPEARVCACAKRDDLALASWLVPHLVVVEEEEVGDEAVEGVGAGVGADVDQGRAAVEVPALVGREEEGRELVVEVVERRGRTPRHEGVRVG